MDWVKRMNDIVEYIETHLDGEIDYNNFGKMLCCSTYEFSRIFSFVSGMSVSEYIRRRRLSQAALDIQCGDEKIIDIALKYGYESQAAFNRAFKEMHGQKPLSARKNSVSLKIYPKISFALIIKGVNEMNFRIEKKDSFQIMGLSGYVGECIEVKPGVWSDTLWNEFLNDYNPPAFMEQWRQLLHSANVAGWRV
ncbi:MAG: AraC family transcriptional regulator [Oscillospiraceae bacterium]|nr:AraC family transcriptional regulator [Oscillospiraceae bacterium]